MRRPSSCSNRNAAPEFPMTIQATLCFILHDNRVLLLKKNPGLFGAGKWNAPGGKLQPKETPEQCAAREVYEETGLEVQPRNVGTLVFFKYDKREDPDWIAHVFLTSEFHGTIKEGKEGILRWFPVNHPPFGEMWEDDKYWYRLGRGQEFPWRILFQRRFRKAT